MLKCLLLGLNFGRAADSTVAGLLMPKGVGAFLDTPSQLSTLKTYTPCFAAVVPCVASAMNVEVMTPDILLETA